MKNTTKNIFYGMLGLFIIAIILVSIITVLTMGINVFNSLSETSRVTVAITILTIASTVGSLVYTKIKERKLQIEATTNSKKQKFYTKFTSDIISLIADPELGKDGEYTQNIRLNFMKNAILWSDRKVIETYHKFRINAQKDGTDEQILWDMAGLFLAFREDLGLSNKNIDRHTLIEILYDQEGLAAFYQKYPKGK